MGPTYPLEKVKRLIRDGRYRITLTALETAGLMGFFEDAITDCVLSQLSVTHFYKPMPAKKAPGLMQDVYKITYEGHRVYLKVQIDYGGNAVIVSFKRDES